MSIFKNSNLTYGENVLLDCIKAGFIDGAVVTTKSGIFSYMMPFWVHRFKLRVKATFSRTYANTVETTLLSIIALEEIAKGDTE